MGNDLRFDKQARDKYITMSIRVVIESSLDIKSGSEIMEVC